MMSTKVDLDRVRRALAAIDSAIANCNDKQQLFKQATIERLTCQATSSNGINTRIALYGNVKQ